ncbi:MAG: KpsF/GutQ family sugar-phosphate isomerase [Proteobacteria bacterium]|nr:KpsF/GutQ family sugar-phosphate isomerase [Pseudomonadota bacterium]
MTSPSTSTLKDLDVAQNVLQKEIEGLLALSKSLDGSFVEAVNIISRLTEGRIIVSGMGKAGHVGRKIAATLASTGTPSFFVHPAEASHGDLGMITPKDGVIALSNSGKTRELLDLLEYTRRIGVPLIAVTQDMTSDLAKAATVSLLLPKVLEACPNGLAPTTSTIMMMGIGDALAVALLVKRGFSAHDFRRFHPGGALGRKLLTCADLMHQGEEIPLIKIGYHMNEALLVMSEKRFGCVGVVNDHRHLVGIITDGDVRRHMSPHLFEQKVEDIMTSNVQTVLPESLAVEALSRMQTKAITAVFVMGPSLIPIGILNIHDCLKAGLI